MLHSQILKLAHYNLWANDKMMQSIIQAGEQAADSTIESSFNTMRKTLYHIYDAETLWILRLNNQPFEYWPPSRDFKYTLNEFAQVFLSKSKEMMQWIEQCDEQSLTIMCRYHNLKGDPFETPVADILMHCLNHSTYHRGQLITMLRQAGHSKVPGTDFILYCREMAGR